MVDYYLALTVINVILVAVLALVTLYYAWTTRQMLEENRLQRIQDAEIRTMPQEIHTALLYGHADTIFVEIQGVYPVTESSFEVKESGGNSMTTKGRVMGQWHEYPGGKILYWINVEKLNLEKYGTDKQFTLTVIVKFKSFLRNEYLIRFESEKLYRNSEGRLRLFKEKEDPETRWSEFRIVEFIPPWEPEQKH